MKPTSLLLLGLFITLAAHNQNCKALDKASFFRNLKFGNQFPPDLLSTCLNDVKTSSIYRLHWDNLDTKCKKKYSHLFKFYSVEFAHLFVSTNEKKQIYAIYLWSFLDASNGIDSINDRIPDGFTKVFNKLKSLYGNPTTMEEKADADPLVKKINGTTKRVWWGCNDMELRLKVTYGSSMNSTNIVEVEVTNRNFDIIPKEYQEVPSKPGN